MPKIYIVEDDDNIRELVSRIKAVLRRTSGIENKQASAICGNVELNAEKHTVKTDGKNIALTYSVLIKNIMTAFLSVSTVWINPALKKGGTDLGLSIVKHIAAHHGGNVEVESKIGKGTDIKVII